MIPSSYLAVYEQLRMAFDQGTLLPGSTLPSEKELAEQHQVSRNTLRKALARLEEEKRIIRRPGIGSFIADPNETSNATVRRALQIGIEGDLDDRVFTPFLFLTQKECSRAAGEVQANIILKTAEDLYQSNDLDAVIFTVINDNNYARAAELAKRVPVILINRITDLPGLSYVAVDYAVTVERVVGRLLDNGAQKVFFVGGNPAGMVYAPYYREQGYRRAFAARGLALPEEWIIPRDRVQDYRQLSTLFQRQQPEVIFIGSEDGLPPVVTALETAGNNLVEKVDLICFDDVSGYDCYAHLALSGIVMPFRRMAQRAVQYLAACCREGAQEPIKELYTPNIMVNDCRFLI